VGLSQFFVTRLLSPALSSAPQRRECVAGPILPIITGVWYQLGLVLTD
jgi:hypothetical protein